MHFWVDVPIQIVPLQHAEPATHPVIGEGGNEDVFSESTPAHARVLSIDNPLLRHRAQVRPLRLLVADDLASNRAVMRRLLECAGHQVIFACNGKEALDVLAATDLDAAILDLHMPDISGLDVMRLARTTHASRAQHPPVVVLSADVTVEAMGEVEANGAFAYLSKPVVVERLLDTLSRIAESGRHEGLRTAIAEGEQKGGVLQELIEMNIDAGVIHDLFDQCLKDAAHCISTFEYAAERNDWQKAREALHALCGVALNLGAAALAERCTALARETDAILATNWRHDLAAIGAFLKSA
jgi:two-component system sensor histidine kinase RpfC